MASPQTRLLRQVGLVVSVVEGWLLTRDGNGRGLTLSSIDRVRLLRLKLWSLRYHLPVEEILDILLPILRAQVAKPKKRIMLGIRVPALVGDGALEILKREIDKRYPGHEHLALWRDAERQKQLRRECREEGVPTVEKALLMEEYPTLRAYCDAYRAKIGRVRREEEVNQSRRSRRNYRWNPWL